MTEAEPEEIPTIILVVLGILLVISIIIIWIVLKNPMYDICVELFERAPVGNLITMINPFRIVCSIWLMP